MREGFIEELNFPKYLVLTKDKNGDGFFISVKAKVLYEKMLQPFFMKKLKHFLALAQERKLWARPVVGSSPAKLPPVMLYFLWETETEDYGIILPIFDHNFRINLAGNEKGMYFELLNKLEESSEGNITIGYAAQGDDPYVLSSEAVKAVKRNLNSFKLRDEKPVPDFVKYFGWCTWNAFYRDVNEDKLVKGLESFKKGGFKPPFVLLDDGWQDTDDYGMESFHADLNKFPHGFEKTAAEIKEKYGVKCFGVWHTLMGYWAGIKAGSELHKKYKTVLINDGVREFGLIHPEDAARFYKDFYEYLKNVGVDMTKADNQNSLFQPGNEVFDGAECMEKYQDALQAAANEYFDNNLLHCMSNSIEVAYHMKNGAVWRNSQDYDPDKEETHQFHIYANAMNNMWTRNFCIPDWDMFQSTMPAAEFHAAARAISGGPIYVSDTAEEHDFNIIRSLCTTEGMAIRCKEPAVPARDIMFTDCLNEKKLLKIANHNDKIGILGLFHCCHSNEKEEIQDTFMPSDVPYIQGKAFAVYFYGSKKLMRMDLNEEASIKLPYMRMELLTISPISNGFAPIGLLNKYNSAATIEKCTEICNRVYEISLVDGGKAGFYCESVPTEVKYNEQKLTYQYDTATKLLIVDISSREKNALQICFHN